MQRRIFLGGAGALVALPALGLLRPRQARSGRAAAPKRLLVYFLPNGRMPAHWVPPEAGPEFSFPATLAPLAPLKSDLICLSGLYHTAAKLSAGTGDHALGTGTILNCAPYPDGGLHGDISLDQALVKAINPSTRFPSLQWGAGEPMACDFGASCSYTQSISWAGPQAPLAPVINPLTAFNQLFGGTDEGATQAEQDKRRASLTSVLETRLTHPAGTCESGPAPADALDYPGRVKAFNDLIALTFQCNQSQVITFMIENGLSGRSHPFIDAPGGHHGLTHGARVDPVNQLIRLQTWQAQQAADLALKLKSMPDIDGSSLLDNTAMLLLPDMGDGGSHDHTDLAPVIVGKCGGALNTGQSLKCGGAPLGNLHVSLLRALGVDTNTFGVDGVAPLPGVNV